MRRTKTLASPLGSSEILRRLSEAQVVATREEPDLYTLEIASPDAGPRAAMRLVTTARGTELRFHVRQARTRSSAGLIAIGTAAVGLLAWLAFGSVLVASVAALVGLVGLVVLSPGRPAYSIVVPPSDRQRVSELFARVEAAIGPAASLEAYRSPADADGVHTPSLRLPDGSRQQAKPWRMGRLPPEE